MDDRVMYNVLRNNKPYRLRAHCVVYLNWLIQCSFWISPGRHCVLMHGNTNKEGHLEGSCSCGTVKTW